MGPLPGAANPRWYNFYLQLRYRRRNPWTTLSKATTQRASSQTVVIKTLRDFPQDDSIKGVPYLAMEAAEQGLISALPDPRKLHRQLGRRHSRMRQRPAIETACESRYVHETG
jgi:hypothetical protein